MPEPRKNAAAKFVSSARALWDCGDNAQSEAQSAAGLMSQALLARLYSFSSPASAGGTARILSPVVLDPLRLKLSPLAAKLVTSVGFADQDGPKAVAAHVGRHLDDELLRETHQMLDILQENLIGVLTMARFPLAYWQHLSGGATPSASLPRGRRTEFTEPECALIHARLAAILDHANRILADARTTSDKNGRLGIFSRARQNAGRVGFAHIPAAMLFAWVDACLALLDDPTVAATLSEQALSDARCACRDFAKAASEIKSLLRVVPALAAAQHPGRCSR